MDLGLCTVCPTEIHLISVVHAKGISVSACRATEVAHLCGVRDLERRAVITARLHWSSIISKLTCSGSTPLVTKVDRSLQASTEVEISISPSSGLANLEVSSDSARGIRLARSLWSFSDEAVSWTGHSESTVAALGHGLLHGSLTASSLQVRRPKSTASASSIRAERWS